MAVNTPLLSICIPTRNRSDLLDYCLSRLAGLAEHGIEFEVVLSDNSRTNESAKVAQKHSRSIKNLVYCHQPNDRAAYDGYSNSARNSSGRFVTYLADDDSLIFDQLVRYVRRLEADPRLAGIVADWVAYDDEEELELHRYFQFREPVAFGPGDPLGLVNFMVGHFIHPEIHIVRREALLGSDCLGARFRYGALRWIYRVARSGTVAFELEPFYRESRRMKSRFDRSGKARTDTEGYQARLQFIGDEMRTELEVLFLWALQDSGQVRIPPDQVLTVKNMIDAYLNLRIPLEVDRALSARNWLLALDLRRRQVLWNGPGDTLDRQREAMSIALPAALQAVRDAYFNLSGVTGLRIVGFNTPLVADHFREVYPDIRLVGSTEKDSPSDRIVMLSKSAISEPLQFASDGYSFALDRLLMQYSLGTPINLGDI